MFDQMSMPVLFTVLISTLAVISIGVFIAIRVIAQRADTAKPTPNRKAPTQHDVQLEKSSQLHELK
jgi:hypothetical protein